MVAPVQAVEPRCWSIRGGCVAASVALDTKACSTCIGRITSNSHSANKARRKQVSPGVPIQGRKFPGKIVIETGQCDTPMWTPYVFSPAHENHFNLQLTL